MVYSDKFVVPTATMFQHFSFCFAAILNKYYIVVQILVINIGICFASSYNVFRADLKLFYSFFESVTLQ